ncbi:arginase [Fusicatenibacter saccharivorans]|uniref:arginase n=1 Tax=Fusicatenibacter saccharivorans TaxID=1150298 RepID=UPI003D0937E0
MLHMYGCPIHLGVGDTGLIRSLAYLNAHYPNLQFPLIPEIKKEEEGLLQLKNLNSVAATCESIASYGYEVLSKGDTPLFIAGDHSAAMGSVSASSVYTRRTSGGDTGLLWIDAHPDINTDETTVTGNIHGMPVAALLGMGEKRLTHFLDEQPKLKPENIIMIGLRDIDPPEKVFLDQLHIRHYTWGAVRAKGLSQCLTEIIGRFSHLSAVHISFDIDSMDPELIPGVSVPVPGGFNQAEVMEMFRTLLPALPVIACDIVEFNVAHDKMDRTADFVSELVSLIHELYESSADFRSF